MGDLGWVTDVVTRLGRPAENVWLVALGVVCVGPLLASVVPRLARVVAVGVAFVAFSLALVATVQEQPVFALGLITLATTAGFVASWSTSTVRQAVGSHLAGPCPRHRLVGQTLTRAQSRSFDYLLMP